MRLSGYIFDNLAKAPVVLGPETSDFMTHELVLAVMAPRRFCQDLGRISFDL
jgi:hypothetical protein